MTLLLFIPSPSSADQSVHRRQKTMVTDLCYPAEISALMDYGTADCSLGKGTAPPSIGEREKRRRDGAEAHKVLPWRRFSQAVKRHRVAEPTGRSTPEQSSCVEAAGRSHSGITALSVAEGRIQAFTGRR